jgi:hypothetical protein
MEENSRGLRFHPAALAMVGSYFLGILEPSVAQPPLPLQLFFALQPLSLDLHPPWPLQSFLPLQECLPVSWKLLCRCTAVPTFELALTLGCPFGWPTGWALRRAEVPPNKPVTAAVRMRVLTLLFIARTFLIEFLRLFQPEG